MLVPSIFGIRGTDINGESFGILYCQIADTQPTASGSRVELVTGEIIKLSESYDALQEALSKGWN